MLQDDTHVSWQTVNSLPTHRIRDRGAQHEMQLLIRSESGTAQIEMRVQLVERHPATRLSNIQSINPGLTEILQFGPTAM